MPRMKTIRAALLILFTVLPVLASAQPRGDVFLLGEGDGKTMNRWAVAKPTWDAQPRWSPVAAPPLPMGKALELGEAWLRKRHPEVRQFAVASITLKPREAGEGERWFYRLEFQPVVGGQRLWGGQFVAVVLFDGTIVEPRAEPSTR